MLQASCLCGAVALSASGDPATMILCLGLDDRKITGSLHTHNILDSATDMLILRGTPKTNSKTVETGNTMVSYFCGDCGSTLYRQSSGFDSFVVIKVGLIEDVKASDEYKPQLEMFTRSRAGWREAVEGTTQAEGVFVPRG